MGVLCRPRGESGQAAQRHILYRAPHPSPDPPDLEAVSAARTSAGRAPRPQGHGDLAAPVPSELG